MHRLLARVLIDVRPCRLVLQERRHVVLRYFSVLGHIVSQKGSSEKFVLTVAPGELYTDVVRTTRQTLDIEVFLIGLILYAVGTRSVARLKSVVHGLHY